MQTLEHLRSQIEFQHAALLGSIQTSAEHAKRLGELLIEVKKLVGHGRFQAWVRENCAFSTRTASEYIRVAESKEQNAADSIRQILAAERRSDDPLPGVAADQLPLDFDGNGLPPPTEERLRYIDRERRFPSIVKWALRGVPRLLRSRVEGALRVDAERFYLGEPGNLVEALVREMDDQIAA